MTITAKICRWYVERRSGCPNQQGDRYSKYHEEPHDWAGREPVGWQLFNGMIDEVRLYNRVLSSNEVRQLYEQSSVAESLIYMSMLDAADGKYHLFTVRPDPANPNKQRISMNDSAEVKFRQFRRVVDSSCMLWETGM